MANSKGNQNKTDDDRSQGAAKPDVAYVFAPQRERMSSYFDLVFSMGAAGDDALRGATRPERNREARLFIFDACMFMRGINALKSARVLCEEGQWEFAVGIVRQLFELVLNIEHLKTFNDRDHGNLLYAKYGLMQHVERDRGALLYAKKTGREIDEDRLQEAEQILANAFPEFRSVSARGRLNREQYWSGHNVRTLAKQSDHPLRVDQYDLLFVPYSDQAHGAPSALVDAMFPRSVKPEAIFAKDSVHIGQTLIMAINLYLELWELLEHVPQADPEQRLAWVSATRAEAEKFGVWPTTPHP
ncbi:DUF5677 domain-containing protein [Mycolicibacterium hippocampi]|uniref:DUF5677 domain-containing protein n=1 Tax=Mycolicibacterium hippocampi TaxID=659824 RepID=UPI0013D391FF|nr:DUF5677 domain-containing protein [Mycolicibacterium hippocampi]